jgi:hypothetical protein
VPTPTITIATFAGSVGESGDIQFTISASSINPFQPITVNYSTSGKAALNLDYTLDGSPGRAIIPAGASSVAITLHALYDTVKEKSEKVTLTLLQGSGYNLSRIKAQRKATISIVNQGGSRR